MSVRGKGSLVNSRLKGEKKLAKVIVPDKWKEGASNTTEGGGRKINENKLLSKKNRWTPYGNTKCIICKQQVHQDAKYCHTCAYTKGVCAMCGKQVLDTKFYKQSNRRLFAGRIYGFA
ncbi:Cysteine-rich PDZ-binding protein, partial [Mucuna pruriens]